jgi:hypothetical protein
MTSPSSPSGGSSISNPRQDTGEGGQARKRARDRKAQQAMRDRAKYTLQSLERQVVLLTQTLQQETLERAQMVARIQMLEKENGQLKMLNVPLHLDLLGEAAIMHGSLAAQVPVPRLLSNAGSPPPWKTLPNITAPTCTSDQILQAFLRSRQILSVSSEYLGAAVRRPLVYSKKPSLCSMLLRETRSTDETSNIAGDIIRSFSEINSLPKQVATHYIISLLVKVLSSPKIYLPSMSSSDFNSGCYFRTRRVIMTCQNGFDLSQVRLRLPTPIGLIESHG